MRKGPDGLTRRQREFARVYYEIKNATEAAKKVGYSEKTAHVQGPRLLGNVAIAAFIRELEAQTAEAHKITRDWLVQKQQHVLTLALQDEPELDRYGKPTQQQRKQLSAANKAIENLAILTGQWVEKRTVETRDLDAMDDEALDAEAAKLEAEIVKLKSVGYQ